MKMLKFKMILIISCILFQFTILKKEKLTKELFEDYYEQAEAILANMTIDQKIGQMFFPRFNKTSEIDDIKNKFPGGFVMFANDFKDPTETIVENTKIIQALSKEFSGQYLGIAVDEEGGTVTRVSHRGNNKRDEPFPSPQDLYNEGGYESILTIDEEKRQLLLKHLVNVNLAPVADFSTNSSDYIYDRTLGQDLETTVEYIKQDVEGYVSSEYTCCAKHFPGYGNNKNTHNDTSHDKRDYDQFVNVDFKPFQSAINAKIPMILVNHNIVECKDTRYPASISETWHGILRNELGYSGLILTDDLSMDAIKLYEEKPAVRAVIAGNDILLTSQYSEHLQSVKDAYNNGEINITTIETAARRVIAWKLAYKIGEEAKDSSQESEEPVESSEEPVQSSEEPVQSSEEPVQSSEEPVQSSEEPVQSSEEPVQSSEEKKNKKTGVVIIVVVVVLLIIAAVVLFILYKKKIICKKAPVENSAEDEVKKMGIES